MAIDNLNFYSNWLPAGQQTDKYSSQPWCLRSKNLDIFSSSKSVKATAWGNPVNADSDIIKQDWNLILKNDGKVYEINGDTETLVVDPSINFPVYQVCYTWKNGTYANAEWGTVKDMVAAYEWDEWKSFIVFTDRASYLYNKTKSNFEKEITRNSTYTYQWIDPDYWYKFSRPWGSPSGPFECTIKVKNPKMSKMSFFIKWQNVGTRLQIDLEKITVTSISDFYYDLKTDSIVPKTISSRDLTWTGDFLTWLTFDLDLVPSGTYEIYIRCGSSYHWTSWTTDWWYFYLDVNGGIEETHYMKINWTESDGDYNESYSYLPLRDRKLTDIGVYGYSNTYWIKWDTYQYVYKWISSFVELKTWTAITYDFVTDMGRPNDPDMEIVGMIIWNEQVYMIWNLEWNWYIIPCDLSWWIGTPYIAYGCEFLWATNIDYLLYLVGEDRGISQLWIYNGQELVSILGGNEEKDKINLIKTDEQYKFNWNIIEYRGNLILTTSDNRVFAYGKTYWGKWWVFIHELPSNAVITWVKAKGNDLIVEYSITTSSWWVETTTNYTITYQDDTPIKNYNTEWMAEYPIVLWNHLLEKEESDLYASYILPNTNCKLEFWGMANHYHFRTFTSSDTYSFSPTASYKMKGCTGNYVLKYIETNGNQYTFKLEWDLPIQTTNDMKITNTEWTELITYSDFNHFRKIGEITTTEYQEWEFRFTNLNNKLELPKSYSLQIMVKGKGTANYTPELFALDLVANQRDRW